jgi:hypothetical protein
VTARLLEVGPVRLLHFDNYGAQRIDVFYVEDADVEDGEERLASEDKLFSVCEVQGAPPEIDEVNKDRPAGPIVHAGPGRGHKTGKFGYVHPFFLWRRSISLHHPTLNSFWGKESDPLQKIEPLAR